MSSVDISPVAPAWVTTVFGNPGSNELPFLNDFLANFHHFLGHRLFAASRRVFRLPKASGFGEAILPVTSLLRRADIMQA